MELRDYLATSPRGQAALLAKHLQIPESNVSFWKQGVKVVPIHHCYAVETFTKGAVTRKTLRPHDWQDYWPELGD